MVMDSDKIDQPFVNPNEGYKVRHPLLWIKSGDANDSKTRKQKR